MMRRLMWRVVPAAVLASSLALSGCGGDTTGEAGGPTASSSTPSSSAGTDTPTAATSSPAETTSAAPALPDCAEVWVEGKRIPKPYRGCLEDDGRVSKSLHGCSMGASLAQYGKRFYGIPGRPAVRATPDRNHDQTYLDLLATCTG
ncbi:MULTISPECIES: hypothetical protein [Nocardioides]|uniref:Secreted protein n=1 Tax=Nocardioides vastitatis TaxID=2568655 RepID=A0ABW0ZAR8_9ACTN|nr:hypothetical protein [Nocardioides sp.]THJ05298.1 hypothetical protein E7Z54_07355 [Nocardioides sp.]